MSNNLHLSLTKELRQFVDSQAGDDTIFATPSEYLRDLIRKDMMEKQVVKHLLNGLEDVQFNRFANESIMDIASED
jgi:antitoxin ParD1/3/4